MANQVTAETLIEMLGKPLPKEGVQRMTMQDGRELTGYKPQYYVDRLNDCFPFDWDFQILKDHNGKYMIEEKDGYVGCFCELTLFTRNESGNRVFMAASRQWGGVVIDGGISWPDAYKGAMSNALGKCCSYFGIGGEAYRGEIDGAVTGIKKSDPLAAIKSEIKKVAAEKGIKSKAFQKIAKLALDRVEGIEVDKLTENELKTILKAISNHDENAE